MNAFARPAMLLVICLGLFACQRQHDADLSQLGPPSHRLVGHWANSAGDQTYFGALGAISDQGDFFMVHPDGETFHHHYALLHEESDTQTVVINLLFVHGSSRSESDVISADGKTLTAGTLIGNDYITGSFHRVDDATVPPKSYYTAGVSVTGAQAAFVAPSAPRWNAPARLSLDGAIARDDAIGRTAAYIFWLHATALAMLLVVSLLFHENLSWLTILTHWIFAVAAGAFCILLLHGLMVAGIVENVVALALLARALFPRSSLS